MTKDNQSINQSINPSIHPSIKQSSNQAIKQSSNQSINHTRNWKPSPEVNWLSPIYSPLAQPDLIKVWWACHPHVSLETKSACQLPLDHKAFLLVLEEHVLDIQKSSNLLRIRCLLVDCWGSKFLLRWYFEGLLDSNRNGEDPSKSNKTPPVVQQNPDKAFRKLDYIHYPFKMHFGTDWGKFLRGTLLLLHVDFRYPNH